jgi:paraquat-inducible protein B
MPDRDPPIPEVPDSRAVPKKQTRLSLVWFIPILAAALGVWVAVARIRSEGPKITIVFQSAEGLEAGKTKNFWSRTRGYGSCDHESRART